MVQMNEACIGLENKQNQVLVSIWMKYPCLRLGLKIKQTSQNKTLGNHFHFATKKAL